MKIDAYFTVPEVEPAALAGATVVVIDVVRATTSIIEALANGARAIYPMTSIEDAVRLASSLGRDDTLLCGERKGLKIEGFDVGNSPREFSAEVVGKMKLVMSTTNGTAALSAGREGDRLLACAFTNLGAVARAVAGDAHLVVICAGRDDRFSLDDALCAGHLVARLTDVAGEPNEINDAADAARALAGSRDPSRAVLEATVGGALLAGIGMQDDLDICAELDRHDIVAEMKDRAITAAGR
jgi:2-phosphosulfolactate phosphatase